MLSCAEGLLINRCEVLPKKTLCDFKISAGLPFKEVSRGQLPQDPLWNDRQQRLLLSDRGPWALPPPPLGTPSTCPEFRSSAMPLPLSTAETRW